MAPVQPGQRLVVPVGGRQRDDTSPDLGVAVHRGRALVLRDVDPEPEVGIPVPDANEDLGGDAESLVLPGEARPQEADVVLAERRLAAILDREPAQRVSAMYLRKTVCMLRGDFAGAESFRRKAEVLGLQASATQMFTNLVAVELSVHAAARDLIGVKRIRDRILNLASKYPGWRVYEQAKRRGAYCRPLGDTVYVTPPIVIPDADLKLLLDVFAESVRAVVT